jgi:hypothetical protein
MGRMTIDMVERVATALIPSIVGVGTSLKPFHP